MELIVLVGLPGSGKTLFAKYMQSIRNNMVRVGIKDIYSMLDYTYNSDHVDLYYRAYYALISDLLETHHVIADDTNLTVEMRDFLAMRASPKTHLHVYQMAVTPQICMSNSSVSSSVMNELVKSYVYPRISEGFDTINGVRWALTDHPILLTDEIILDRKPEIFEIESKLKIASR